MQDQVRATSKIAQFREDFHLVVVRVEIFGGESLAAPRALQATPSRAADPPTPRHLWLRLRRAAFMACNQAKAGAFAYAPENPDASYAMGASLFVDLR
jgi:hypothetical protein